MFAQLNFKSAGDGGFFWLLWGLVTVANFITVTTLVGGAVTGALLAWRWFGWS